eukprot:172391_1
MASSQESKELRLLIKIFAKIRRHPKCEKYKSINIKRVTQKLTKSNIDILLCCGFYKSDDSLRLLFDETRFDTLPLLRQLLSSYNMHDISDLHDLAVHLVNIENENTISRREECDNDISKCQQIRSLSYRVKTYTDVESLDVLGAIDRTEILNEFHHILTFHDMNDDDFDYVVSAFGGPCELENCKKMQRYYNSEDKDFNDNDVRLTEYLLDRIHCYIHHGYDTFRFTKDERTQMEHLADGKAQFERRSTILRG